MWYIKCPMIYERPLFQRLRRDRYGKILRHSRAMSGYVGLLLARKRRREVSASRRRPRSLKAECADLAVGPVALIVEIGVGGFPTDNDKYILTNDKQ